MTPFHSTLWGIKLFYPPAPPQPVDNFCTRFSCRYHPVYQIPLRTTHRLSPSYPQPILPITFGPESPPVPASISFGWPTTGAVFIPHTTAQFFGFSSHHAKKAPGPPSRRFFATQLNWPSFHSLSSSIVKSSPSTSR